MAVRLGIIEFRPTLVPSLVTLVFLVLLISLGFWQLDRARQKQAILDNYQAGNDEAAIRIDAGSMSLQGIAYQHAVAQGHFDTRQQFLLDNRTHDGVAGYYVITPFLLSRNTAILVNRGWVPLGVSRDRLPDIRLQASGRTISGKLKPIPKKVFMLGKEQPRQSWPYRVLHINIDSFSEQLGYRLSPYVLLLDPAAPGGYVRDWKPMKFGPERNVGYAVQWFSLAAALLLIYFFVNTRKVK